MDEQDKKNLMVAAVVIVLIAVSIWLLTSTRKTIKLEDCTFSGRRNCNPIPMTDDR